MSSLKLDQFIKIHFIDSRIKEVNNIKTFHIAIME